MARSPLAIWVSTFARRAAASAPGPVWLAAAFFKASEPRINAATLSSSDGAGRVGALNAGSSALASARM